MYLKRNKEFDVISLYLRDYKKELYLREINRLAKIPLKTTQNLVLNLQSSRILKSEVRGKNKYFKLNLDNIETKFYLLQSEIHRTLLFLKKYPLFKSFIKEVKSNTLLVVFGGFAKFKAEKDSDVDLLVLSKEKLPFHVLPYSPHKIELSEKSFVKASEEQENIIKEIEENHIVLNNHSYYINQMWNFYGK